MGNAVGIDLGNNGISGNDRIDSDSGPNDFQNFPELSEGAAMDSGTLTINYLLPSDPAYSDFPLSVEFYKSDGNRQGIEYLGNDIFTVNDISKGKKSKAAVINLPAGSTLTSGDKVTAIATDASGNTSEFSAEVQVTGNCTEQIWYADNDGDSYGVDAADTNISSCIKPGGNYVSRTGDCNDNDAAINPDAVDIPDDGIDQNCDGKDATTAIVDTDGDGIADSEDNCPEISNPDQLDSNGNGVGDACEGNICLGTNTLNLNDCTSGSTVYWSVYNPGDCATDVSWEVRKGSESGAFLIDAGETVQFTTSVASKGPTQLILYWKDGTGTETKISANTSGRSCTTATTSFENNVMEDSAIDEAPYVYPNPIEENGFYVSFSENHGGKIFNAAIYDLNGRLIGQNSFNVPNGGADLFWQVNTESWIPGVYVLKLNNRAVEHHINLAKE